MIISVKQLASSFENINRDPAAFKLARDIESFSDYMDPFGYRDYVDEIHGGDVAKSINSLYNDIMSGDIESVLDWLAEQATDINLDKNDQRTAFDLFYRLYDYKKER